MVLALGAAEDVRLKVVATHGLADEVQPLPCPDGVLLRRIWQLVDREVEQRWDRLPRCSGRWSARPAACSAQARRPCATAASSRAESARPPAARWSRSCARG